MALKIIATSLYLILFEEITTHFFKFLTFSNEQATLPETTDDDELNQYMYCREHLTNLSTLEHLYSQQPAVTFPEALHLAIVQCVQLHRFILDACKELEELFNPFCLVKSIQVTLQLCLLVFIGVAVSCC